MTNGCVRRRNIVTVIVATTVAATIATMAAPSVCLIPLANAADNTFHRVCLSVCMSVCPVRVLTSESLDLVFGNDVVTCEIKLF